LNKQGVKDEIKPYVLTSPKVLTLNQKFSPSAQKFSLLAQKFSPSAQKFSPNFQIIK